MRILLAALIATSVALPAAAQPAIDVATARASLVGEWDGSLEYLDYSANQWFGIPVKTMIEDQGDGATIIRKSDFDDGPKIGIVRITSVELFDAAKATVSVGTFRKGRAAEINIYTVLMEGAANDPLNWTMIEEVKGSDDNRPALLRITTKRTGNSVEALKQVDFQDDDKVEWLSRNRTKLTLKPE
jgi:hypothetical protein